MKHIILIALALLFPFTVLAQDHITHAHMKDDHVAKTDAYVAPDERGFPADYHEIETTPEIGKKIKKYVLDDDPGAQKNFGVQQAHDNEIFWQVMGERMEYRATDNGEGVFLWDATAWIGNDYNKLQVESEGEKILDGDTESAEVELLYSRNVRSFWDVQAGIRHDFKPDPTRSYAVFGVQGVAPYWFEIDAGAYLSDKGDLSAQLEAEYDLLLSQRAILQPRFETIIAAQSDEAKGVGSGINDIELGLRLRYEFSRKFAPYVGVEWERKFGETADFAQDEGEDRSATSFVTGIRFWF